MWLYFCFSIVFLHVISTNLAQYETKNANDPNKETEAMFAGVIKNISRVNNVLQELISNYEHLQKIYKSQENLESASSDAEIDEVFKSRHKKIRTLPGATSNKPTDYFPATQIIWSNGENNHDSSDDEDDVDDDDNSESNDSDKTDKHEAKVNEGLDIGPDVNDENNESVEKSEQDGHVNKKDLNRQESNGKLGEKQQIEAIVLNQELVKPKIAKIIFIDTHKSTPDKEQNIRNKEPENYQALAPPKTRYSKISHNTQDSKNKHSSKNKSKNLRSDDLIKKDKSQDEINNDATSGNDTKTNANNNVENNRKVEKKLHSESFSHKNIWDEIISNKPIQLEAHNEMIFKKVRKDNSGSRSKKGLKMRSEDSKTALVNVTNKNKTENIKNVLPKNDTNQMSEINDSFGKDEFEASVLREAYGDACLKLVVRKCYLAAKKAGKSVCEKFKCKGTYKEKYDSYARTACIEEFHGKNNESLVDVYMKSRDQKTDTFRDFTREGYMQACLPHVQTMLREPTGPPTIYPGGINATSPSPEKDGNINILRDKYERACKKISCEKCQRACRKAYIELCESFTCNSDRKKAYKKSCKRECKKIYKTGRGTRSSSDSDSSGSDSSGSSGSSDSDSD